MNSGNKYFAQKTENREQTSDIPIRRLSSVLRPLEVGFPIRKFTDQSLFAAPHDLSQRTTSFIASQRQGIHQIPLRHLIALIANARRSDERQREKALRRPLFNRPPIRLGSLRTLPLVRRKGLALDF